MTAYTTGMELEEHLKSEHDSQVREVTDENGNTAGTYHHGSALKVSCRPHSHGCG